MNLEGASCRSLKQARGVAAARTKILVVGASNAERLALMLEQKACSVTRIITTNWRPSRESVEVLAAMWRKELKPKNRMLLSSRSWITSYIPRQEA